MEKLKNIEISNSIKEKKIIILGYGQVGQYFSQVLKENGCKNVFVVSKREGFGLNNWGNLPIKIDEVDYIINTHKLPDIRETTESIPQNFKGKILYVQNGFDVKELVKGLGVKKSLFSVLNISAKHDKNGNLGVKILKESPITGKGSKDIEVFFNKPDVNIFKESSNFDRELIKKGVINSIFNPLCVIYNKKVKDAINEYGFNKIENLTLEILSIVNKRCKPKIKQDEIWNYIMKVYENFGEDFPSTHGDFYEKIGEKHILRNPIKKHELDHLVGYLFRKSKEYGIKAPLIEEIYNRIKEIENKR